MNIVALTDIHGKTECIEGLGGAIARADLVILAGDITHFGGEREAEKVVAKVRGFNKRVLAVPGNCDYPGVLSYLENEGLSLHRRPVTVEDHLIAGVGGALPGPGRTPGEYSDEEFGEFLEELGDSLPRVRPFVFVSHEPPRGTLCDRTEDGEHVGSAAIRRFIETHEPILCVSGHIHEAIGIDAIGKTKVVNPGPLGPGRLGHHRYVWASLSDRLEELKVMSLTDVILSI